LNSLFKFEFDWENWKEPWSISEYASGLKYIVEAENLPGTRCEQVDELVSAGIRVYLKVEDPTQVIYDAINEKGEVLRSLHAKTVAHLTPKNRLEEQTERIIRSIEFPPSTTARESQSSATSLTCSAIKTYPKT
jgi:hypothetical protein